MRSGTSELRNKRRCLASIDGPAWRCCDLCSVTAGCVGYSHTGKGKGGERCLLKSSFNGMVVKRRFRSALLIKGGLCPAPVDNTDVSGSVLAEFISRPVTDCCSLCKLTTQCTAFAWTSNDDITGTCVMKSGTDLTTLSGSKAAVLWEYTSGRLESKATFTLTNVTGSKLRVEYTAKVPTAEGAWPALWMLGIEGTLYGTWPSEGEIDVMEWVYQLGDSYVSALHWKGSDDWGTAEPVQRTDISNQLQTSYKGAASSQGFKSDIET